jgi:hypothetical protein
MLIVEGILNKSIQEPKLVVVQPIEGDSNVFYIVVTGSYKDRNNAET